VAERPVAERAGAERAGAEPTVPDPVECPRCAAPELARLAVSPVPDAWVVWVCRRCSYSWRSSEPPLNSSRAHYPGQFRLVASDIDSASEIPAVPERS
jgi:rubredoxin